MEQAYAQALWQMIADGKQPASAVKVVYESLKARGRQALMPRVAKAFERIAGREAARTTMMLSIARAHDAKSALKEAKKILANQKIDDTDLCEVIDETLIGGWRLEGRGVLVDASFKKQLLEMYNRATA